jgi:hypothetical protein
MLFRSNAVQLLCCSVCRAAVSHSVHPGRAIFTTSHVERHRMQSVKKIYSAQEHSVKKIENASVFICWHTAFLPSDQFTTCRLSTPTRKARRATPAPGSTATNSPRPANPDDALRKRTPSGLWLAALSAADPASAPSSCPTAGSPTKDDAARVTCSANPKGIDAFSPGLLVSSYPG